MHSADEQQGDTSTIHHDDEREHALPTEPGTDASGVMWKRAPDPWGDYLVSDDGRVVSLKYSEPRERSFGTTWDGYDWVALSNQGEQTYHRLNRLVWQAHRGPIPEGHHIHHVNGRRQDNRIQNLEPVPATQHRRGHSAKLSAEEVAYVKWIVDRLDVPHRAVAEHFGVSSTAIQPTAAGKIWKEVEPKRPDAATLRQVRQAAS